MPSLIRKGADFMVGLPTTLADGTPWVLPVTTQVDAAGNAIAGNTDTAALITLTAQGAGTVVSADQTNYAGRGLKLVIDITAVGGTPTCTVTLQGKDPVSGKYYTLLVSAALAAAATTVLEVYPGCIAAANLVANSTLPRTWRISAVVAGGTPSVTATMAASVIV